jgi:hypothetical protein
MVPAVNRKEVPPSTERRYRRQPKGGTICQVVAPRSDYLPGPSERSAQGTGHRKEHEKSNTSHTVWTQIFARRSPCKILQTTVTVPPVRYQLPGSRYRQEHYLPVPSERIAQGAGFRKEHDKSNTSTTVWTQIFARRSPAKILQTTVTVPPGRLRGVHGSPPQRHVDYGPTNSGPTETPLSDCNCAMVNSGHNYYDGSFHQSRKLDMKLGCLGALGPTGPRSI